MGGIGSKTAEGVTEGMDLSSKTYLITGVGTGLGLESLRVLTLRGATVIALARSQERAAEACAKVSGGKTIPLACDIADPASIRACVAEVKKLNMKVDALLLNAGIMALPSLKLVHGYEAQFFTNHIGHFMLTTGVLECLADDGRVVITSSEGHKWVTHEPFANLDGKNGYSPWSAYGSSKLANILFAKELSRRFQAAPGNKRTANALHPGVINTELTRNMNPVVRSVFGVFGPLFLKSIPQGAATQVFLATSPTVAGVSGKYFAECAESGSSAMSKKPEVAAELWAKSEAIVSNL
jgi:NAD(P)-dependent dehydrogenase (short-subunit alcohol dehydrogenase family)